MYQKSQRIRITEPGWVNYNGPAGGVMFHNNVSVEPVDAQTSARLGSILRIQMLDTDTQAGVAAELGRMKDTRAEVVAELPVGSSVQPVATPKVVTQRYSREELEKVADKNGIAGLRAIAEPLNVKGRGIAELITEILAATAD